MRYGLVISYLIFALIGFHGPAPDALAAENSQDWRPTYDMVMMWINFVIFAAVIVKLARNPLKGFFRDQKEDIAREISRVEQSREKIATEVKEAIKKLEECDARFARIKETALQEGEKKRQEIIDDARQESRLLIEQTKVKIEHKIRETGLRLRAELVDAAVEHALQRLSKEVTAEDDRKYVDRFLNKIAG